MYRTFSLLAGAGLGAGLMYFLDPRSGRRRRAVTADKATRLLHEAGCALDVAARDASHRARGLWAAARAAAVGGETPDDWVLAERVRSRLGRVVSHPHAIRVSAAGGAVTLSGPILADEADSLVACAAGTPGVARVENRLEAHRQAEGHPALQGGGPRPGEPWQDNWSPALRFLAGAAGTGLMANCLARRTPPAVLLGTLGFGLFVRGVTNTPFRYLVGATGGRSAVTVQKAIMIGAPAENVFPFFARYDSFPEYMRHVREVRDLGGGRSHWKAAGPGGIPVSWNAVVTRYEPNQLIAWRSEPGSTVANAGMIRFEPQSGGRTRVTIRLTYNPPGGALGHFAATLFGRDPRSEMDEDLIRLKGLIETGKTAAPGKGEVTREDVVQTACTA
jgi:uncharacterized membrane protein